MKVLLIEDDPRLAPLIQDMLEEERIDVDVARDGGSGVQAALSGGYDVLVVDWMLPDQDGPSICRTVRSAQLPVGILMLTARSQVEDRVKGLNMGADDYLTKPFAFDELVARIYAVARRFQPTGGDSWELRVGQIVMDLKTHTARRGESELDLSKTEWTLLEYLLRHANQVVTRQNILDYVWSDERRVQESMVDVYISYLRKKLDQPRAKDPIQTVRGVGYQFKADDA